MASPAAMLPPAAGSASLPRAAPRARTPSPSNGPGGAPGARPEARTRTRARPGRESRPASDQPRPRGDQRSLGTLQPPLRPLLAAPAAQAVAGQPGAARQARKARGAGSGGAMSVSEMFAALQAALGQDQDIREEIRKVVQALEQTAREMLTLLQGVHQGPGFQHIPKKCQKAREHFGTVRTQMESLKTKFPADQYYRFHEHWRFVLQRLVFLAAFVVYLESETLVTREAVAEILGIEADRERGFHLDIEDYLSGVLTLASELARLAVNSVTAGDYSRPLRISTFINELDSGFRLLNLKNDSLRKRYDGLKYDVKKIEEVVYDLSIRGLSKEATVGTGGEK
ncbi:translin [Taeniopygia guttata]|uniref:translin n=1 Tax=Taeniopygia guttata TaxID=59729 RepID=UPI003BB8720F